MIRDHDVDVTPLQTFRDQITRDVQKIWNELSKPEEFKETLYTDLFELRFYSLPHKRYQEAKFLEGIENLRKNFNGQGDENYFQTVFHQKKSVPAESLGMYAKRIWDAITTNKDLNIPSEKKMLAMFRCDEILHSVVLGIAPEIAALREKVQQGYQQDFRSLAQDIIDHALAQFDEQVHGYDPEMVAKKKEECANRIREELRILYLEQLGHARSQVATDLRKEFAKAFPRDRISSDFYQDCKAPEEVARKSFSECAQQCCLEGSNWNWESAQKDLEKSILELEATFKASQLEALNDFAKDQVKKGMSNLDPVFARSEPNLWSTISSVYVATVTEGVHKVVDEKLKAFKPTAQESFTLKKFIYDAATSILLEDCKREALYVKRKMHNSFDRSFKLGPDGVSSRQWRSGDNIRQIFEDCVEKVGNLIFQFFFAFNLVNVRRTKLPSCIVISR
jgi:hypothetical protein